MAETLDSEDLEATLFAPTDLAFETLAERQGITVEELLEDTEYLSKVLHKSSYEIITLIRHEHLICCSAWP